MTTKKLTFAAGCMSYDQSTNRVRADPRQGTLVVEKNSNDEKIIRWIDDKSKIAEMEVYVFSGDALFDKVKGAPNRVYYLHFKTFGDRYFFWFQDPDETKDKVYSTLINNLINDIEEEPKPKSTVPGGLPAAMNLGNAGIFSGLPRSMRGGLENPSVPSGSSPDYRNLFSQLQNAAPPQSVSSFVDVFPSTYIDSLMNDSALKTALIPLLPEGQQTEEGLRESLRSPQFQQALEAIERALRSEEGISVLRMLGFDEKFYMDAKGDGLEALLKAVIEKFGKKNQGK